jgi:hypothetical protein
MKIEKEFPATHSMSTAWYVADEDGNVAIMNYNDNGPVPWETEQTSIEELVYGHYEDYRTKDILTVDLTDDQIDDLMENPHQPESEKYWIECIFQIDLEKETDFLSLAKNPDFEIELCISKKRGLYSVDCFKCIDDHGKEDVIIESSSLKKMLDHGMIKQIYYPKNFFINDNWEDGKIVYEYHFSSAPYYIYAQPYWNDHLAEKINTPVNPVKLSQFPLALQNRIPRVPLKFSECQKFQIAEWHPCRFTGDAVVIKGFEYQPIVLTDGSTAYVYTSQRGVNFHDYCSEKTKHDCKECSCACYTADENEYSDKPTVMFVFHPFTAYDYQMTVRSDDIIRRSIRISLLHKIPFKHPKGYYMSESDAKKEVTEDVLTDFFLKNHQHFADTVLRFNPQVIILEKKTKDLLSQKYLIDKRHITIEGNVFPYYMENEIEKHREEITKLALLPYRGIEMPYLISMEEMEEYKKNASD